MVPALAPKAPPTPEPPPEAKAPPTPPAAPETVPQVPVATPATPVVPAVVESKPTPKLASQGKREVIPEAVQAVLNEAERALDAGQFEDAIRLALRSQREQKTQAAVFLLARAYCRRLDLSNAKAQWRLLPSAERRRVSQYCKKYGMDL